MSLILSLKNLRTHVGGNRAIPNWDSQTLMSMIDNIIGEAQEALDKEFQAGVGSAAIARAFNGVTSEEIIKKLRTETPKKPHNERDETSLGYPW